MTGLLRLALLFAVWSTVLTGCSEQPVAEDLTQEQAREVVAVLSERGIASSFERERRGSDEYTVAVSTGLFSEAVKVLHETGVPERSREAFTKSLSSSSFLPDSRLVEAMRLDHAKSLQIESLLENFPQVISAKVVVQFYADRLPRTPGRSSLLRAEEDPFDEEAVTGSAPESRKKARRRSRSEHGASVVLKTAAGERISAEEVQNLIRSVIPGLSRERIHISLAPLPVASPEGEEGVAGQSEESTVALQDFLFGWRVAREDYLGLALSLFGTVLLFGCAGLFGGYWYGYMTSPQRDEDPPRGGAGRSPFASPGLPLGSLSERHGEDRLSERGGES
ncbi:hypothetical protein MRY87_10525 [bacterium]|nr:hypothetical protein [bacterium]